MDIKENNILKTSDARRRANKNIVIFSIKQLLTKQKSVIMNKLKPLRKAKTYQLVNYVNYVLLIAWSIISISPVTTDSAGRTAARYIYYILNLMQYILVIFIVLYVMMRAWNTAGIGAERHILL